MAEKMKSPAKSMNSLLGLILAVIVLGLIGIAFLAAKNLPAYALEVNDKLKKANLLDSTTGNSEASKASKFYASSAGFKNQAEADIRNYAAATGVTIKEISQPDQAKPALAVQLSGPVNYSSLVSFTKAVEGNLPGMTVSSIGISKSGDASSELVNVNKLTITVSVK